MNISVIPARTLVCLIALLVLSAVGSAWIVAPPCVANETLKQAMSQMDDALKVLSKGVTAENRVASLEELAKFQAAVLSAKAHTPESAAKVEEKKRAAFVGDFRKTLVEGLQFSCATEVAIIVGKYKEADTLIRNKISALKSTGHGKFKPAEAK